jgi:hypothetical protein
MPQTSAAQLLQRCRILRLAPLPMGAEQTAPGVVRDHDEVVAGQRLRGVGGHKREGRRNGRPFSDAFQAFRCAGRRSEPRCAGRRSEPRCAARRSERRCDVALHQSNAGVLERRLGIVPAALPEDPELPPARVGEGTLPARLLDAQPRVSAAEVAPFARGKRFQRKRRPTRAAEAPVVEVGHGGQFGVRGRVRGVVGCVA